MKRYCTKLSTWVDKPPSTMIVRQGDGWKLTTPRKLRDVLLEAVWKREERAMCSPTATRYLNARYDLNPLTSQPQFGGDPRLIRGIQTIIQCRVGGFWTAEKLARRKLLNTQYLSVCPCCRRQEVESIQHILLECPRWELGRQRMLGELILSTQTLIGEDVSGLSSAQFKVALLLGGEYNGKTLESWGLTASNEAPQTPPGDTGTQSRREDDGTQEQILVDNPHVRSRGCLRVASFFEWMMRGRAPIIQVLRREFQGPSPTSDQRPVGQGSPCTGQNQEVLTGS